MKLIILLLAGYGLANAIAVLHFGGFIRRIALRIPPRYTRKYKRNGKDEVKETSLLGDLFHCPTCLGFWFGIGISILFLSPSIEFLNGLCLQWPKWKLVIAAAFMDGLCVSAFNYFIHAIAERLDPD